MPICVRARSVHLECAYSSPQHIKWRYQLNLLLMTIRSHELHICASSMPWQIDTMSVRDWLLLLLFLLLSDCALDVEFVCVSSLNKDSSFPNLFSLRSISGSLANIGVHTHRQTATRCDHKWNTHAARHMQKHNMVLHNSFNLLIANLGSLLCWHRSGNISKNLSSRFFGSYINKAN